MNINYHPGLAPKKMWKIKIGKELGMGINEWMKNEDPRAGNSVNL